jgi:hypothetical protein
MPLPLTTDVEDASPHTISSLATISIVMHRSRGDWEVTDARGEQPVLLMVLTLEAPASGAGGGTGCGCVWLGVLCEWCPPTKVVTHSGILFVTPIDWVAPKAVYTLAAGEGLAAGYWFTIWPGWKCGW